MPENPERRLERWVVYVDDGTCFERITQEYPGVERADSAKQALEQALAKRDDKWQHGQRFAVRLAQRSGPIFLFKLSLPKQAYDLGPA